MEMILVLAINLDLQVQSVWAPGLHPACLIPAKRSELVLFFYLSGPPVRMFCFFSSHFSLNGRLKLCLPTIFVGFLSSVWLFEFRLAGHLYLVWQFFFGFLQDGLVPFFTGQQSGFPPVIPVWIGIAVLPVIIWSSRSSV